MRLRKATWSETNGKSSSASENLWLKDSLSGHLLTSFPAFILQIFLQGCCHLEELWQFANSRSDCEVKCHHGTSFLYLPKCGAIEAPNRVQSHCDLTRTGTCRSIWTLFQERTSWKFPMWRFHSACQDRSSTGSSCLPTCTIGARSNWDWAPVMESWLKSPFGRGGVGLVPYQHPINLPWRWTARFVSWQCLNFIPGFLDTLARHNNQCFKLPYFSDLK